MMRSWGTRPGEGARRWRQALPWLTGLVVLLLLGAAAFWLRGEQLRARSAATRADVAEAQVAVLQASLTAVVRAQAQASATAAAQASLPAPALERALALVFATYRDPTDARLAALAEAFGPRALTVVRREAEHLRAEGLRLSGESAYEVEVLATTPGAGGETSDVRTRETWVYDERDGAGRRVRCIRERSEQTYGLKRVEVGWLVDTITLGEARRAEC